MKSDLYRAVYCSRAKLAGSPADISREIGTILGISRRNNGRVGLTGALLFTNHCFAQALEGDRKAVETCFERIQIDPRHSDVTVLEFAPAAARDFSSWSMAFAGNPVTIQADSFTSETFRNAFTRNHEESGSAVLALLRRLVCQEEFWALA